MFEISFREKENILIDFGKTMTYSAAYNLLEKGRPLTEYLGYLYSHRHSDHFGDIERILSLGFQKFEGNDVIQVVPFEVAHNIENHGFFIVNSETKEALIFMIDFYAIKEIDSFIANIKLLVLLNYKIMIACELAYCNFLYQKLPKNERWGLDNHLSDEAFISLFKEILKIAPNSYIVTLHASGREYKKEGVNASVCPKDYVQNHLKLRLKKFVHYGVNNQIYTF